MSSRVKQRRRRLAGVAATVVAVFISSGGRATDLSAQDREPDGMNADVQATPASGPSSTTVPAGVNGATMFHEGNIAAVYLPVFTRQQGDYVGTNTISTAQLLKVPNTMGPLLTNGQEKFPYIRIAPSNTESQLERFGFVYGITDAINLIVLGSYSDKETTRTTWCWSTSGCSHANPAPIGARTDIVSGFSDTSVVGLFRLYDDGVHHIHLNLGLGLPTGADTANMVVLNPAGLTVSQRAPYGMQPGTGELDALPGLSYTGKIGQWSWGAIYRGRFALDDNNQHYHWGDLNELSGWAGYALFPGVTATARLDGTVQGKIDGRDPLIFGARQAANPAFYGGELVSLFGGLEFAGREFGLGNTRLAIEAGPPIYQNLNGPQLGRDWQINVAFGVRF